MLVVSPVSLFSFCAKPSYLQYPDLRIRIDYLRWRVRIASRHAEVAAGKGRVLYLGEKLLIDIEIYLVSLGYYCQYVLLTKTRRKCADNPPTKVGAWYVILLGINEIPTIRVD